MEFSRSDLLWTKNVKREQGNAWAYSDHNTLGDIFLLSWPRGRADMGRTNALAPKINDLILLFQTVNRNSGSNPGTYLTHIVTPIETEVSVDESSSHPFQRRVMLVARGEIPKPIDLDFREPNRGWICKFGLIKSFERSSVKLNLVGIQEKIWDLFQNKDVGLKEVNLVSGEILNQLEPDDALEGEEKYLLARHKYYERDPKIIKRKKALASEQNNLRCEVCGFDFSDKYGVHGIGFIECHHILPIAKNGIRKTTVNDLSLVCANCHRMLHKKNSLRSFYNLSELKVIVDERTLANG